MNRWGRRHQLEKRVARADSPTTPPVPTPRMVPPDSPRRLFRLLYHPTPICWEPGPVGQRRPSTGPEPTPGASGTVADNGPFKWPRDVLLWPYRLGIGANIRGDGFCPVDCPDGRTSLGVAMAPDYQRLAPEWPRK